MILPDLLILPVSQIQTQQVMTSQIRSHRIFNTDYYIFVLSCNRKLMKNLALMVGVNTI